MRNIFLILLLIGCSSSSKKTEAVTVDTTPLVELKEQLYGWVDPCSFNDLEYPCERNGADTNEDHVTLWAGLSCLSSGDFCDVPFKSLDSQGKLWRSPSQVGVGKPSGDNSSSRDMYLGFLAALVKTKDQRAAWLHYKYLEAHDMKICDDADDNRCDMNPSVYSAIWGTMKHVFKNMGMQPTPTMEKGARGDEVALWAGAKSPVGYQLHLVSIQLHIRKAVGYWNGNLQSIAETIAKKDSDNAYFEYLAYGVTQRAVDITYRRCSKAPGHERNDWIWSSSNESMGYDCLFMISLLGK